MGEEGGERRGKGERERRRGRRERREKREGREEGRGRGWEGSYMPVNVQLMAYTPV